MSSFLSNLAQQLAALMRNPRTAAWGVAALGVPAALAAVLVLAVAPAFDRSDRIPVAVVNLDEGSRGGDLVDSLAEAEDLSWRVVGEGEAVAGLADGSFALALVIPADYTQKVESIDGDDPQKATVDLVSDGTGNVLATRAGSAVMRQVQSRLKSDLGERYVLGVLNDVRGQASRLAIAADGSTMLDAGYDALADGANAIARALAQTGSAATQLTDGLDGMGTAAGAAGAGAGAVGSGLTALREQAVEPLAQGADALATGLEQAAATAEGLGRGVSGVSQMVEGLEGSVSGAMGSVAVLGDLKRSLEDDGGTLEAALDEAGGALQAADDAVRRADDAVGAGARDEAAALASGLAGLSQAAGERDVEARTAKIVGALDSAIDALEELAGQPGEAEGAQEEPAPRGQEIRDVIDALGNAKAAAGAESLAADAAALEDGIAPLVERSSALAAALSGADGAGAELQEAGERLEGARAHLDGAAGGLNGSLEAAGGSLDALSGHLMAAQGILSGQVTGRDATLAELTSSLGSGVSALGAQLSREGLVGQGAAALTAGASAIGQALTPLADASDQIAQGVSTLSAALSGIGSGASGLGGGLTAMASASGQLAEGSLQLKDAAGRFSEAAAKASDALADVSSGSADRAEVASSPVAFNAVRNNEVASTASAVSPAFIAAALWVGALMSALVLPPFDARAVLTGWVLRGVLAPAALYAAWGLLQALLVGAACVLLCGAVPASSTAFWGLLAAGSIACSFIAQAFKAVCGRWAPAILLALLALQLVCAGTILPEALASGPFAALGGVLPVPVLATALRGAVSGTLAGLLPAAALLAALAAASLAASLLAAFARRSVRPERLPA